MKRRWGAREWAGRLRRRAERLGRLGLGSPALAIALAAIGQGCVTRPGLERVDSRDWERARSRTTLDSAGLSEGTQHFLWQRDLTDAFRESPIPVLRVLDAEFCRVPTRRALLALSELCCEEAGRRGVKDAQGGMLYLSGARYAYAALFDADAGPPLNVFDPRFRFACALYNRCLAGFLRGLAGEDGVPAVLGRHAWLRGEMRIDSGVRSPLSPDVVDRAIFARDYRVRRFPHHQRSGGLGVPMVGVGRHLSAGGLGEARATPAEPVGLYAATLVLRFEGDIRMPFEGTSGTLDVYDSLLHRGVSIEGRSVPLEVDYSILLGAVLEARREQKSLPAYLVRLRGEAIRGGKGLYMVQDYVPGKIPVVLVHGLMDSPLTWLPLLHEMVADPELSQRYQPWLYLYPTGDPIVYSAAGLREALHETRRVLDPSGEDPALDRMVLVGHSMGGLVSRLMIQRSDGTVWERLAGIDLASTELSSEDRLLLRSALVFEPVPYVRRVVFIATPHRGAGMARSPIGSLGNALVSLPGNVVAAGASALTRNGGRARVPTGINNLEPGSILVEAINSIPFAEGVPYHSIIANRRAAEPGGSDGLVAFESAHLQGAESELIVRRHHNVQNHPLAIREVRRILLEHLEEADRRAADDP